MQGKQRNRSLILEMIVLGMIATALACGRGTTPIVIIATPTATQVAYEQPPISLEPTSTPVAGSCTDGMQFIADVSVPDGTSFGPNEAFIKTWRIRNAGLCTWSGYRLLFSGGEPMGSQELAIPETPAGETLDLSIEMTAPGGAGHYTGKWDVRSPDDAVLGTLTCVIIVSGNELSADEQPAAETTPAPSTSPPTHLRLSGWGMQSLTFAWDDAEGESEYILMLGDANVPLEANTTTYTWQDPPCGTTLAVTLLARDASGAEVGRVTLSDVNTPACREASETITLQSLPAEDGYVRGLESGESINLTGEIRVGDGKQNRQQQAFLSFDISSIPQSATIRTATLDLSHHTVEGTPFASLGVLRLYKQHYETLDPGDFSGGFPTGLAEWHSPPTTVDVTTSVQHSINNGVSRFQVRLQFQNKTNGNDTGDRLCFPDGGPSLTITYVP